MDSLVNHLQKHLAFISVPERSRHVRKLSIISGGLPAADRDKVDRLIDEVFGPLVVALESMVVLSSLIVAPGNLHQFRALFVRALTQANFAPLLSSFTTNLSTSGLEGFWGTHPNLHTLEFYGDTPLAPIPIVLPHLRSVTLLRPDYVQVVRGQPVEEVTIVLQGLIPTTADHAGLLANLKSSTRPITRMTCTLHRETIASAFTNVIAHLPYLRSLTIEGNLPDDEDARREIIRALTSLKWLEILVWQGPEGDPTPKHCPKQAALLDACSQPCVSLRTVKFMMWGWRRATRLCVFQRRDSGAAWIDQFGDRTFTS